MNSRYKRLLSLDSIFSFLKQSERIIAIKKMLGNTDLEVTDKMELVMKLIDQYQWKPPENKYGQDRLLYYLDNESWKHISEYTHPILIEIQKLK